MEREAAVAGGPDKHNSKVRRYFLSYSFLLTCSSISPSSHQFLWCNLVLAGHQLVDCLFIIQEQLHPDERLLPLLCQHVVLLRPCQQVRHTALRQPQDVLSKEPLADGVLREDLLDLGNSTPNVDFRQLFTTHLISFYYPHRPDELLRVDVAISVKLLLRDGWQDGLE